MDKNNFIMSYSVDKSFDSDKFLKIRCCVCHDQQSNNLTFFTKETMEKANKESLEYIPILAHVYENDEGNVVLGSHDMHIEEDKLNEGQTKQIFDETPIGMVPSLSDNNCTIEEHDGLNYTYEYPYIWIDYSKYEEQLVEDAKDVKLSMEIDFSPEDFSYDAKNNVYNIAAYRYRGITLLNGSLGTGMKNAKATTTFSECEDVKAKMIVLMEELKKCLCEYDIENSKEGGNTDMEENKIIEPVVEEPVTEEPVVETMEEEPAADETPVEEPVETEVVEEEVESEEEPVEIQDEEKPEAEEFSEHEPEELVCTFRISHDDTRYALQNLLNSICGENQFLYIESVYDGYFYYADYFTGDAYKQAYKVRKDVVSFSGDPERVYREFVTQSEKDELENMRKNYSELVQFKASVEAAELKAKKDAIFARSEYSILTEEEEFKALVNDAEKFSVEEVESKMKSIFADHVIKMGTFSARKEEKKESKEIAFNFAADTDDVVGPYGKLFMKK